MDKAKNSDQRPRSLRLLAELEAAHATLIESVMADWEKERSESPDTLLHYRPMKELRYCEPGKWLEVTQSADDLLKKLMIEKTGLNRLGDGASELHNRKAMAVFLARSGANLEQRMPGLLDEAVRRDGGIAFLEQLNLAYRVGFDHSTDWKMWVAFLWAHGIGRFWPLSFWADEPLIEFLEDAAKIELSIKQWRDFRRDSGLVSPTHILVRKWQRECTIDGDLRGFLIETKPKKSKRKA